jgi:ribonucleoside-diphosphate reductase alpha chain
VDGSRNAKDVDWNELKRVVHESIHFLDNVVEVNQFPVVKIREMVSKTRRVGLGLMGFADMLFKLGVRYDSDEGAVWAEKIMKFVQDETKVASVELAKTRGVFPAWEVSVFANTDYRPRNMALTTIAPTGTISMIADASSGVEPAFSLGYQKNTVEGKTLYMMNPVFVAELKRRDLYNEQLLDKIVKNGGKLTGIEGLPDDIVNIYRTAMEISPEWHVKIQAAFQKYTDNAVSKTINFPKEATVDDVRVAYRLAYALGTKGITIYRSGSREKEVIAPVKDKTTEVEGNGKSHISVVHLKSKKKTPEAARGVRLRKTCDVGKVYTSVFFEEGDGPVEVFVNLGKSGGYLAGASEVTGRLASLALKYGATLDEVADELVGVSCGQKVGLGSNAVLSMFDAVGKAILEISRGEQLNMFAEEKLKLDIPKEEKMVTPTTTSSSKQILAELRVKQTEGESKFSSCPDCGSPLYAEEGCFKCSNGYCGYSKCS